MNIDHYIPVLMWNRKSITEYNLYLEIEIPVITYSKDGYPNKKKQLLTEPIVPTEELEELQKRAKKAIITQISLGIHSEPNQAYHALPLADTIDYVSEIINDSSLYFVVLGNYMVLHIQIPKKHCIEYFKEYLQTFPIHYI